jgi:Zn-dependent protease with chaperone function
MCIFSTLIDIMILYPKVTIFALTAFVLLSYLFYSIFANRYAMGDHSSSSSLLLHKTSGEGTVQICCSWGDQIADGILMYRIIDNSNNPQVVDIVHQAIDEWNSKVPNIKLQEVTRNNTYADIDIKIGSIAPQVSHAIGTIDGHAIVAGKNTKLVQPGETVLGVNSNHHITHADITISTTVLGNSISPSELESTAKHEIGHAYGIGHTDFGNDLMSPILTGRTDTSISSCDINAVLQANIWKTAQRTGYPDDKTFNPYQPSVDFIECK